MSVVLPVYNCPDYVGEAIESVLNQTFSDFELILIDDGSRDRTPAILRQYTDRRVRLITQSNRGLAATLNRGIELSRGRYLARQDQDDVSFPNRLEKQVALLDTHRDCALVGTWAEIWRGRTKTARAHRHPADNATLKFELLFNNPFVHSSVMIRKAALEEVGGYCTDGGRQPPEDYELWSRIAREYEVANVPELLHVYREVEGSMSRIGPSPFLDHLVSICAENIAWAAGTDPSDPQVRNIAALVHFADHRLSGTPDLAAIQNVLRRAAAAVVSDEDRSKFVDEAGRRAEGLVRSFEVRHRRGWRRRIADSARRVSALVRRC